MKAQSSFGAYESDPFVAELYDLNPVYAERTHDIGFYLNFCREANGPVLELGCGTGRILLPAAREEVEIVGLDLSAFMLDRCKVKLAKEDPEVRSRVELIHGTMTDFSVEQQFALTIIPFRAFQHLVDVANQISCLRCIARHLRPGGRLVFDVFNPDFSKILAWKHGEEIENVPDTEIADGRKVRRTHRLVRHSRAGQFNEVELISYVTEADGSVKRYVQAFPMRYFSRFELEHLLARNGFEVETVYGNFDPAPFEDDSPEMVFVARKEEGPQP